jgi:biopolymer transport protein ExbB
MDMILTELLEKGGIVMAIILSLSVYVVAVIGYKTVQFWQYHVHSRVFLRDIVKAMNSKRYVDALKLANNTHTPLARVIETALKAMFSRSLVEEKKLRQIEAAGTRELRFFESHLRGLEMVAAIAPLLGLLGTVIGMVKAFAGIGEGGAQVDPSILAGGIWEALLNTAAGLAVAIPALAAYYLVDSRVEYVRATMKDAVSNLWTRHDEIIAQQVQAKKNS